MFFDSSGELPKSLSGGLKLPRVQNSPSLKHTNPSVVNMLGMMNVSSDSVEFYSANNSDRKYTSQVSEEQTKAFTEIKHKPEISYTPDGRRLIDGKLEKEVVDGVHLWHTVIKRKALSPPVFGVEPTEEEEDTPDLTVTEGEPVVSCSPRREDEERNEDK